MPNRIRELRKAHCMTMKQLGAEIGVAESTISQYETGKRQPDNETLLKLGEFFEVSVDYLLGAERKELPDNIMPLPRMREWKVIGATACGLPIHRELNGETVLAPDDIDADCVFRCVGDSMIGAHIFDGDLVFVKVGEYVEDGKIAVVRVGEEYSLKRIFRGADYLELRSENPAYSVQIIRGEQENAEIVGKAVYFLSRVV